MGIRFHVRHDDGLVAGFAVPCTFSHSNFAGNPRMFVLVSETEFSVISSHGAIGSQLKVPTSACWPRPEMFWKVIALSWIDVLPAHNSQQNNEWTEAECTVHGLATPTAYSLRYATPGKDRYDSPTPPADAVGPDDRVVDDQDGIALRRAPDGQLPCPPGQ